jgi:hypothetical protein
MGRLPKSRGGIDLIALAGVAVVALALLVFRARVPDSGSAPAAVGEGSTAMLPSLVNRPDQAVIPTSPASQPVAAEPFVLDMAFQPGGQDVALTVNTQFPDSRALFVHEADDATGALAVSSTLLSGLPELVDAAHHIQGGLVEAAGYVVETIQSQDHADGTKDSELYALSGDLATMQRLTVDGIDVSDFRLSADGSRVAVVTTDGRLLAIDTTDGHSVELLTGLITPSGGGGAALALSADGAKVAVASQDDVDAARLRVVDVSTGAVTMLLETDLAPEVAFSADGADLLYTVNSPVLSVQPSDGPLYQSALFSVPTQGGSPVQVADLTAATGNALRAGRPVLHPDGGSVLLLKGEAIYEVDLATGQVNQRTPVGETVTHDPVVSASGGSYRLGYTMTRPMGPQEIYHTWGGEPLRFGSFARSLPLQ